MLFRSRQTSKVRVHLTISACIDVAVAYVCDLQLSYTIQGSILTIELDEHAIAQLLTGLGERKIIYSHILIDKPTLEDYFLSVAKK